VLGAKLTAADADALARLDTIPGVARRTAEVIAAELGCDMTRFPTAGDAASWAGLCPGNHESAGKRLSGRTRFANRTLRAELVESARGAIRKRDCYLAAQYRRLVKRRGDKKAIVAVAHSIIVIATTCSAPAWRIASWAATTSIASTRTASPATIPSGWPPSAILSPSRNVPPEAVAAPFS
jgi:hypothetical protein